VLQGRSYRKGILRRTRFLCEDLENGKKYLINALANVKLVALKQTDEDGK
jgi:hypothetical protein